jgi:hypothetical protein
MNEQQKFSTIQSYAHNAILDFWRKSNDSEEDLGIYDRTQRDFFYNIRQMTTWQEVSTYLDQIRINISNSKNIGATTLSAYKNALAGCEYIIAEPKASNIETLTPEEIAPTYHIHPWIKFILVALSIFALWMLFGCDPKDPLKDEAYFTLNRRKMDVNEVVTAVYNGKYDSFPISFSYYQDTMLYYSIDYDTISSYDGLVIIPFHKPINGQFISDRKDTFFFHNYSFE